MNPFPSQPAGGKTAEWQDNGTQVGTELYLVPLPPGVVSQPAANSWAYSWVAPHLKAPYGSPQNRGGRHTHMMLGRWSSCWVKRAERTEAKEHVPDHLSTPWAPTVHVCPLTCCLMWHAARRTGFPTLPSPRVPCSQSSFFLAFTLLLSHKQWSCPSSLYKGMLGGGGSFNLLNILSISLVFEAMKVFPSWWINNTNGKPHLNLTPFSFKTSVKQLRCWCCLTISRAKYGKNLHWDSIVGYLFFSLKTTENCFFQCKVIKRGDDILRPWVFIYRSFGADSVYVQRLLQLSEFLVAQMWTIQPWKQVNYLFPLTPPFRELKYCCTFVCSVHSRTDSFFPSQLNIPY